MHKIRLTSKKQGGILVETKDCWYPKILVTSFNKFLQSKS